MIRALLKQIYETTPIHFPDYVLEYFPKVMQQFIVFEQSKKPNERVSNERMSLDSSYKPYKLWLKKRVDDDYQRFYGKSSKQDKLLNFKSPVQTLIVNQFFYHTKIECRHETQAQTIFQSQNTFNTLLW